MASLVLFDISIMRCVTHTISHSERRSKSLPSWPFLQETSKCAEANMKYHKSPDLHQLQLLRDYWRILLILEWKLPLVLKSESDNRETDGTSVEEDGSVFGGHCDRCIMGDRALPVCLSGCQPAHLPVCLCPLPDPVVQQCMPPPPHVTL